MKRNKKPAAQTSPKLVPPVNFSAVEENRIYRSAMPDFTSVPYLETLHLRSDVYLCPDEYDKEMMKFLRRNKIKLFQFGIPGKTDPSTDPQGGIAAALKVLADKRNHPVLIHCRGGKHYRTGCLVGCLRMLQNWSVEKLTDEYKECAGPKSRENDIKFLETYDVSGLKSSLEALIQDW